MLQQRERALGPKPRSPPQRRDEASRCPNGTEPCGSLIIASTPPSLTDFHTPRTSKARQTPNETRRREGETGKAGTEGGETTTPPSLVHLQERPGPPQEHHTRRAETDAHARPSGGRAARRGDPLPCRDSESQPAPKERRRHDTGSCLPRFGTPTARARAGKQGRAGYRTPAFHTPPTVGQRSEGPAGSTRSAVHSP